MTQAELYSYLEHPEKLNHKTLPELKQLVDIYPFAGTLVFLYLYNLSLIKDLRYPSELRRLAPRIPDRRLLFGLVNGLFSFEASDPAREKEDSFSIIDKFLQDRGLADAQESIQEDTASFSEDYFSALDAEVLSDPKEKKNKSQSVANAESILEEEVIQNNQAIQTSTSKQLLPESASNTTTAGLSEKKIIDGDEDLEHIRFTETLAKIYAQQKRYEKSLHIFQNIVAKNPEKNITFANQIRFLEILIENNSVSNKIENDDYTK